MPPSPSRRRQSSNALLTHASIAIVLVLLLFTCPSAAAVETAPSGEAHTGRDATPGAATLLGFGGGILAAYAIHEGSHLAAAGITGTDLHWESGTYNQPLGFTEDADDDTSGAVLHGAGLVGQALSGEIVLALDCIDKTTPFIRGLMIWNIANPIIYAFDYWILHSSNRIERDGYQGDLAGIEHYAGRDTANLFAATSVGLALWQGYRFWKAQAAPPPPPDDGLRLGIAPAPQGGALLSLNWSF
ncbi:MAG: hypothetical protein QNJ22_23730 [Desulfosarcinaceae bacterium]|nr:hypothetical protein [Desulfosarcinaceae bacterium]